MAQTAFDADATIETAGPVLLSPSGDVVSVVTPRPGEQAGPQAAPEPAPSPAPAPSERPLYMLSSVLTILGIMAFTMVLTLGPIGSVKHARDQQTSFDTVRGQLANATTVVTQTDSKGRLHPLGTPVGILDIPQIGVREVVLEGTTSGVLSSGPGHSRDSAMPGQAGVSVILGRQAAYGGPFKRLKNLVPGNVFSVTTGQGKQTFRVIATRVAGDPLPPVVQPGKGRLVLVTAAGADWVPEGTLRVDADLVGEVQPSGPRPLTAAALPVPEKPLQGNPAVWIMVLLVAQALFAASFAVTWARFRWGGWQVWLTGGPLLFALGVALADQVAQLLPNLL